MPGKFLEYIKVGSLAVPVEITFLKSSFYDHDPGTFVNTSKWSQPCHWREIKIMLKPALELVLDHNDSVADTISKTNSVSCGQDVSFGYVIALNNHKSAFLSLLDVKKNHWTDDEEDEMDLFDNIQDLGGRYKNLSTTKYMIKACAVLKSKSKVEDEKKIRTELGIKADDLAAYLGLSSSSSKCSSAKKRKRLPRLPQKNPTPLKESLKIPTVPKSDISKSFEISFTSRTDSTRSSTDNFQSLIKPVSSPTKEISAVSAFAKKPATPGVEDSDGWNDCDEINGSYYEERDDNIGGGIYCGNVDDDDEGSVISWELPDIDQDPDKVPYFDSIPDYLININTIRSGPRSTSSSEISLIDKPKRKKKKEKPPPAKPTESESELHAIYGKGTPLAHLGDLIGSPTASPTTTIHSISTVNVNSLAHANPVPDKIVNYFESMERAKAAEEAQNPKTNVPTAQSTLLKQPALIPTAVDEELRQERMRKEVMEKENAEESLDVEPQCKGRLQGDNLREIELEMARLAAMERQKKLRKKGHDSCTDIEHSTGALSSATLSEIFRASESEGERRSDKQRSPFKKSDIVIQKWVNDSSSKENEAVGKMRKRRETGESSNNDRVTPITPTPTSSERIKKGKENSHQQKGPMSQPKSPTPIKSALPNTIANSKMNVVANKVHASNKVPNRQVHVPTSKVYEAKRKKLVSNPPVKAIKPSIMQKSNPKSHSRLQRELALLKESTKVSPIRPSLSEPPTHRPLGLMPIKASLKEIQISSQGKSPKFDFNRRRTRSRSREASKSKNIQNISSSPTKLSTESEKNIIMNIGPNKSILQKKHPNSDIDPEMPILQPQVRLRKMEILLNSSRDDQCPVLTPMQSPISSTSMRIPSVQRALSLATSPQLILKEKVVRNIFNSTNKNDDDAKKGKEYKENELKKSRLAPKDTRTIITKKSIHPSFQLVAKRPKVVSESPKPAPLIQSSLQQTSKSLHSAPIQSRRSSLRSIDSSKTFSKEPQQVPNTRAPLEKSPILSVSPVQKISVQKITSQKISSQKIASQKIAAEKISKLSKKNKKKRRKKLRGKELRMRNSPTSTIQNKIQNKNIENLVIENVQKTKEILGESRSQIRSQSKSPVNMKIFENICRSRSQEFPSKTKEKPDMLKKTFENLYKKELKNRERIKIKKTSIRLNLENIRNVVVQEINRKVKLLNESSSDLNDSGVMSKSKSRFSLEKERENEKEAKTPTSILKLRSERLENSDKQGKSSNIEKPSHVGKSPIVAKAVYHKSIRRLSEKFPNDEKTRSIRKSPEKSSSVEKTISQKIIRKPSEKSLPIEKTSKSIEKEKGNKMKRIPTGKTLVVLKVPSPKKKPGKKIKKAISKVKRELRSQMVSDTLASRKSTEFSLSSSQPGQKDPPREKIGILKNSKRMRTSCEAAVQTEPENDSQLFQLSQSSQVSSFISSIAATMNDDEELEIEDPSPNHNDFNQNSQRIEIETEMQDSQRIEHEIGTEMAMRNGRVYEEDFYLNEFPKIKERVPMTPESVFRKHYKGSDPSPLPLAVTRTPTRRPPPFGLNKNPPLIDLEFEEASQDEEKDLFSFEGIESPPRPTEPQNPGEFSSPEKFTSFSGMSHESHNDTQEESCQSEEEEPRPSTSAAAAAHAIFAIMPSPAKRSPRSRHFSSNDEESDGRGQISPFKSEEQRALEAIGITEDPSNMPAISLLTNQYVLPYWLDCVNKLSSKEMTSLQIGRKIGFDLMPPPVTAGKRKTLERPSSPDMVTQSSKIVKKMRRDEQEKEDAWSLARRTNKGLAEQDDRTRFLKAPYVKKGCDLVFKEIVKRYSSKAAPPMKGNVSGEDEFHQMSQGSISCIPFVQRYPQKSSLYKDHLKKIKELDPWDILEIFQEIKDEIIGIFEERIPSLRHNLFLIGRGKLRELKSLKVTFPFGNALSFRVIDLLYALLIPHPEDRCKWALYIDTVMMPEALIRIYAKVNGIEYKLAEKEMRHGPCYDDDEDQPLISLYPSSSNALDNIDP